MASRAHRRSLLPSSFGVPKREIPCSQRACRTHGHTRRQLDLQSAAGAAARARRLPVCPYPVQVRHEPMQWSDAPPTEDNLKLEQDSCLRNQLGGRENNWWFCPVLGVGAMAPQSSISRCGSWPGNSGGRRGPTTCSSPICISTRAEPP